MLIIAIYSINPSRQHRSVAAEPRHFANGASASSKAAWGTSVEHSGEMLGEGHPRGYRFWHTLSDASFGIYLVHVFILTALLQWVVPFMPEYGLLHYASSSPGS